MANTLAAQIATNPAALATGGGAFFDTAVIPLGGFPFNFMACFSPEHLNNPACFNQRYITDGPSDVNFGTDPNVAELDVWGINATIDWDVNDTLRFKSITSWREFRWLFHRRPGWQPGACILSYRYL